MHASVWLADGGVKKWLRYILLQDGILGRVGWLKEFRGQEG